MSRFSRLKGVAQVQQWSKCVGNSRMTAPMCTLATNGKLDLSPPSFLSQSKDSALKLQPGQKLAPPLVPVKVRGRYGLPGAACETTNPLLPETLADPLDGFPAVLRAEKSDQSDSVQEWARVIKPELDRLLPQSGVVVIDGLENCLETSFVHTFTQFMESMKAAYGCTKFMAGRSMTSTQMTDLVRTGSDDHPAYTIEPHNEYNVAAKHRPRKLFLLCSEEATDGGEWVITDSSKLLANLSSDLVEKFNRLGVRYEIYYPSESPDVYNHWQGNIAPTREEAEEYLRSAGCEWEWDENDDSLFIHRVLPAMAPHPDTGELLWFNQIHAHHRTFYQNCHPDFENKQGDDGPWPVHTKFGDGSELSTAELAELRQAVWAASVSVPLRRGLLMVVDNYRALHGRLGYTPGTPRQTLVSIIYE